MIVHSLVRPLLVLRRQVSRFCAENIRNELQNIEEYTSGKYGESLVAVFHRMDDMMRTPEGLKKLLAFRDDQNNDGPGNMGDQGDDGSFDFLRSLIQQQAVQRGGTPGAAGGEVLPEDI